MINYFLCIGGPFDGTCQENDPEISERGYFSYNCAIKYSRGKFASKRAEKKGTVIPPSMIWVHKSCLGTSRPPANVVEAD